MRKFSIKAITYLMLAAMLLVGLSGCEPKATPTVTPVPTSAPVDMGGYEFILGTHWIGEYEFEPGASAYGDKFNSYLDQIRDDYNCLITVKYYQDALSIYDEVSTEINSGIKPFDICDIPAWVYNQLLQNNMLYKMNEIPGLDLTDAALFNQGVTRLGLVKGNNYGTFFGVNNNIGGIFFNKKILEQKGQPDPYAMVEAGTWTFDEFEKIAKAVTEDKTNDGIPEVYGLAGNEQLETSFVFANGGSLIAESGDSYSYNVDSPKSLAGINFLRKLAITDNVVSPTKDWVAVTDEFATGKAAFLGYFFWAAEAFLGSKMSVDQEYGFVPYPKGPDATDYTTPLMRDVRIMVMPKTLDAPDKTGILFAKIAEIGVERAKAWRTSQKSFGVDDKGLEMFDMLTEKASPDYASLVAEFSTAVAALNNVGRDKTREPASEFAAYKTQMEKAITDYVAKIK